MDLALAVAQVCYFISISPTEAEDVDAEIPLVGAGFAEGGGFAEDEEDIVGAVEYVKFVSGDKHGKRLPFGFLAGVLVSDSRGRWSTLRAATYLAHSKKGRKCGSGGGSRGVYLGAVR
jgi:hypothetical protein